MDGFKNSTKTHYMKGGSVGERKIGRVMEEFTKGKLHSGSKEGPKVKSTKQAVAIALNEARAAGAKIPRVKKARGGMMEEGISTRPVDSSGRRMTNEELGMTPGGVDPAKKKKPVMAKPAAKKPVPKAMSDLERARLMVTRPMAMKQGGGVPAYSSKPMIGRNKGGLAAMPKGKC
ncbi:hypothetical protein UFOVP714_62 [uncultured Caudovirales phage]|uniref:Uncharacterized protein n=1 Tax=uncultured Caudovirales phage TaxID=2100421 RepID=A0A6J5PA03_9CAUD|nr:hypothetical protein UFOVP714_62 [uncultured Caudovirales phage]CAB4167952.1 hypothetical protein UFOVP864_71 [uncultured Caudovirales phage]